MEKDLEAQCHALEEYHWWFHGRRAFIRDVINRVVRDPQAAILEIGCSAGPLLQELRAGGYTNVTGIDISPEAIALCARRGISNVVMMDAQRLGFPPASFDFAIASDVLEHLPDARAALRNWLQVLRPGGRLLVLCPAFMFLWSEHDVANRHQHRYTATELNELLRTVGFQVERRSYWNWSTFVPVAAVRLGKRVSPRRRSGNGYGDLTLPPRVLNSLLKSVLAVENKILLSGLGFPWGVTAWVLCRKP
jgi:SAM-dependent methyltransferase